VTELLSGEFFQLLGLSSSHQMWSSAMVLTPAVRGLFGLDFDAIRKTLCLRPRLPAQWNSAKLHHVKIANVAFDLEFRREGDHLVVTAISNDAQVLCLVPQSAAHQDCTEPAAAAHQLRLELPPVEIGIPHGLPEAGSPTRRLKIVDEQLAANHLTLTMEAPGGSTYELPVRINRSGLRLSGAEVLDGKVRVQFPPGESYQRQTVTLRW
jgi:hypothetical protein